MDERLGMLKEIQELEFAAVELVLFLDTHPQDQAALRDFYAVQSKFLAAVKRYEDIYGPISFFSTSPGKFPWQWIEDPWPWEIDYA